MALTWAAWVTCALAGAGVLAVAINMTLRPTPHPGLFASRVAAATGGAPRCRIVALAGVRAELTVTRLTPSLPCWRSVRVTRQAVT